ncbi:MAG: hypothetical protein U0075_25060 [Thermomicrobiales bacterium]
MAPWAWRTRNRVVLVLCILLGLVSVPVECAAVWGPHSVFISAQEVSALRSSGQAAAGEMSASHHHHHMAVPETAEQPTAHHAPGAASTSAAQGNASAPSPASMSLDAAVSFCLLPAPLRALVAAPRSMSIPALSLPGDRFLPAPEPPPPISL